MTWWILWGVNYNETLVANYVVINVAPRKTPHDNNMNSIQSFSVWCQQIWPFSPDTISFTQGGNRLHKGAKIVQKLNWNTLLRNTFLYYMLKIKWGVHALRKYWIWTWYIALYSDSWFFQFLIVCGINYVHFYLKCRRGTNNFLG